MNLDDWHEHSAELAYAAHGESLAFPWTHLPEAEREKWRAVSRAVLAEGKIEVRPSAELAEAATREENERLVKIARECAVDAQSYRDVAEELRRQVQQYHRSADEHVRKFERKHEALVAVQRQLDEVTRARNYLASSVERLIDSGERTTQKWEMADAEITALKTERDTVRKIVFDDAALSHEHRMQRLVEVLSTDDVRACTSCGSCSYCRKKVGNGEA